MHVVWGIAYGSNHIDYGNGNGNSPWQLDETLGCSTSSEAYTHVYTHVYIHVYKYVYRYVYKYVYIHVYPHVFGNIVSDSAALPNIRDFPLRALRIALRVVRNISSAQVHRVRLCLPSTGRRRPARYLHMSPCNLYATITYMLPQKDTVQLITCVDMCIDMSWHCRKDLGFPRLE